MKYSCEFCSKTWDSKVNLRHHVRRCRKNPNLPSYSCDLCKRTFTRKKACDDHMALKKCQKETYKHCFVPECEFTYFFKTALIEHLKNCHMMDIKPEETHEFESWSDFLRWKDDMEERTFSYYSLQSGMKKEHVYYYCQRDGSSKSHLKSTQSDNTVKKRKPVTKGRIKTGAICTSMLKVSKRQDGSVVTTYFPTHSHPIDKNDLKHQPLNSETNKFINNQLSMGVSPEKIETILKGDKFSRENRNEETLNYSRNDFICIKNLQERRRRLLSAANSLYSSDATSTLHIIKKLQSETYDPVLIFKPIGDACISGPESAKELSPDTFILGLQTKEQLQLMEMCSREILVIDATHDMTHYGCQLLNIVGVDETNRGYPLGHCISNKMDEYTLQYFFRAIKERSPSIIINCVITDDDSALINAVCKGFNQNIRHILCQWHFKRTLKRQLHAKIQNINLETEMFKVLCSLIDATTEHEFSFVLEGITLSYLTEAPFMDYFLHQCIPKKEKWAKCYRNFPHKHVDTTMYVKAFHNILKSVYLKHKPNKRCDTLINLILQVEEDYHSRRNISLMSHEREVSKQTINSRHERSLLITNSKVTEVVENAQWTILEPKENMTYDVIRCAPACTYPDRCFFQCDSPQCLGLCTHLYVCTCSDESTLCEHIHKVHTLCISKDCHQPQYSTHIVENKFESIPPVAPYVLSNNSSTPIAPCQKKTGKERVVELSTKIIEHVQSDSFPRFLLPHVTSVLTTLLAECETASSDNPNLSAIASVPSFLVKTETQVLPQKKKRKAKKTNSPYPKEKPAPAPTLAHTPTLVPTLIHTPNYYNSLTS